MSRPVHKLGKLLPGIIAKQPGGGRMIALQIGIRFREILGPALAGDCEEIELHGSVLTVITRNPALAHQLRLDTEILLGRLNDSGTPRKVRELRVRNGRGPGPLR